jgi:threonine dehydratase
MSGTEPVVDEQVALAGDDRAEPVSDERIERARQAGANVVKRTPILTSTTISGRVGGHVVLKAENLQRTGSFKIRGAMAKLSELGPAVGTGVVAGSAGNHAQAVAFAARALGAPCEIYVPDGASISKTEAARAYGASVLLGGDTVEVALAAAHARAKEAGMAFIHPFDDPAIISGQATLGLELAEDVDDLRRVIVPVGGGGLASGVAIAVKRRLPHVKVVGVQAEVCAPYANQPAAAGPITTLADGIAVKEPGRITAPLIESWLDDVVTVSEDEVADAMVLLMERAKLFVEGGGAVGVAALLAERVAPSRAGVTAVVLSGGNVDLGVLPGLIRRAETRAGRRLLLFVKITDRPGGLARLLSVISDERANLIEVEHVREGVDLHVRETGIQLAMEVRNRTHAERVIAAARAAGYVVEELVPH